MKYGIALRNARLDAIETILGTAPLLEIFTGAAPTNPGDADSGVKLVSIILPSDWMAAASGGTKALAGSWSGTAIATGTAGYFRIKNSAGSVVSIQGDVTTELVLNNVSIANGQTVSVSSFTLTAGNG